MTNKKTFRTIITIVVMLAVMISAIALFGALDVSADAAQTPTMQVSNIHKNIFGQGTHIYVVAGTNGGTAVYYMNGSTKVYLNPNGAAGDDLSQYTIYGGPNGYYLDGDTYITMTGGTVKDVYGAGAGANDTDASLGQVNGNVNIKITGGTVTGIVGASGNVAVNGNVNIEITGGTIGSVYASVYLNNYGASWRRVTGDSTITITGSAKVNGDVFCGSSYYPVDGVVTLVSTAPIILKKASNVSSAEYYIDKFLYKDGSTWKVKGNVTIPSGAKLTIAEGETLSVPVNATLNNNGTIVNNGNLNIVGTVNNNGSISCTNHTYTYACDKTCNLCDSTRDVSCEVETGSVSGNTITVSCKHCGETAGTVTISDSTVKYNGNNRSLAVSVTGIYAGTTQTVSYTKSGDDSFSGTPMYPGTYTGSVTVAGATVNATLTIEKADLSVATAPSVTYFYGEDAQSKDITGKVVAATNSSLTVNGTWAWSGNQAVFTPDSSVAAYFNTLPAQTVTHNVQAVTPIIEITAPSPSAMPGMKVNFEIVVKNPYTNESESLPKHYVYKYRVGTTVNILTSSAAIFTIPDTAALGDTIYIYVENLAEDGKYAVGQSNTVEIYIGQVDYSEDIEKVQTNLDEAIARLEGVDAKNAKDLADAIASLNSAIEAAKTAAQNADAALRAELVKKIDDADKALDNKINQVQINLDNAVARLDAADKKNADDLAKAIADLNAAVDAAEAAAEAADAALKAELVAKIDEADKALEAKIDEVQKNLDDAVDALEAADKKNSEDLAQAILDLNAAIDAAEAAAEAADAALRAELVKKIDDADAILQENIDKVQENLDTEVERLDKVDKENADALAQAIVDLQATIKASQALAKAAAQSGDRALKATLEEKINAADAALEALIDEVQANLDAAIKALEEADESNSKEIAKAYADLDVALQAAKAVLGSADKALEDKVEKADAALRGSIEALEAKDKQLNTMSVVAIVLGGIGLLGNAGLLSWIIVDKKKKLTK